ncbi:uncharacterized protein (DUF2336 family) [Agrobacterium vitis]|nr:uncharacterized protein (DUF2336 family) [Agrobacterium vitis]MBE1439222.1 uncharacterized protein (DUF2336 family) [Agrobacterium vitis]
MATVSSFESIARPGKADLKQFALLFQPLFQSSTLEARRAAVAALSQSPNVPEPVAFFIACQPISVSATFLSASPCLSDELLLTIARTQGKAHVRAIVRREALSPAMIDALVGLRFAQDHVENHNEAHAMNHGILQDMLEAPPRSIPMRREPAPVKKTQLQPAYDIEKQTREEALRQTLKALDQHLHRPSRDRQGLRSLTPMQEALLVRFARTRDTSIFANTLADALSSSRWLAERIILDLSGRQLATTLLGLAMSLPDITFVLSRFYPHLKDLEQNEPRIARLIASLDGRECQKRIDAWLHADRNTTQKPRVETAQEPDNGDDIVAYLKQSRG